jgi:hypothetical protein
MEGTVLSLAERQRILPGEALSFAAIMAVVVIAVMAVVIYRLWRGKEGGVKLPGGWQFTWK